MMRTGELFEVPDQQALEYVSPRRPVTVQRTVVADGQGGGSLPYLSCQIDPPEMWVTRQSFAGCCDFKS
jgi:hypothetical protein